MKPPIRLREAFGLMNQAFSAHKPQPFCIEFSTKGGERIVFDRAMLPKAVGTAAAGAPAAAPQAAAEPAPRPTRGRTRSFLVKNLTSQEIRWVHPQLVETLNGHPVL